MCSVNIKPLVCRVIVCDLSQISAKSASNNKTSRFPEWQNLNYSTFVGKNFGQSFQSFFCSSVEHRLSIRYDFLFYQVLMNTLLRKASEVKY